MNEKAAIEDFIRILDLAARQAKESGKTSYVMIYSADDPTALRIFDWYTTS